METTTRHLLWYGVFLFLLGLLPGLVEQHFTNVRTGLEGVMNGTLPVALGAIWANVRLPPLAKLDISRVAQRQRG